MAVAYTNYSFLLLIMTNVLDTDLDFKMVSMNPHFALLMCILLSSYCYPPQDTPPPLIFLHNCIKFHGTFQNECKEFFLLLLLTF